MNPTFVLDLDKSIVFLVRYGDVLNYIFFTTFFSFTSPHHFTHFYKNPLLHLCSNGMECVSFKNWYIGETSAKLQQKIVGLVEFSGYIHSHANEHAFTLIRIAYYPETVGAHVV